MTEPNKPNQDEEQQAEDPRAVQARRNARLVFTDPDEFFSDLLMEQQEKA